MADTPSIATNSSDGLHGVKNATTVGAGVAQLKSGVSLQAFVASLAAGAIAFAVEVLVFTILRKRLQRIFEPRSYLVPERKRAQPPPSGLLNWLGPVFTMSNSEFISKSGLDAYFFLRYLRMLCKIFFFLCLPIFPLLIPINYYGGNNYPDTKDSGVDQVKGMDVISISNIAKQFAMRTTAHLLMAIYAICLICYIAYDELRGYVRMRQAYLTSPQHRLRASATTVLVTSIPRRWMSYDALVNLYDVFPGGLKNIWLNRDYSDLEDKIKERDYWAMKLEAAETDLIKKCRKAHEKKEKVRAKSQAKADKKAGIKHAKEERTGRDDDNVDFEGGMSSGAPLERTDTRDIKGKKRGILPIPIVGRGLDMVVGGIQEGFQGLKDGVQDIGQKVGEVLPDPDRSGFDPRLKDSDQAAKAAALSGERRNQSIAPQKLAPVTDKDAKRAALADPKRHSSYGSAGTAQASRNVSHSASPMHSRNNLALRNDSAAATVDANQRSVEDSVRAAMHGAAPNAATPPTLMQTTSPDSYLTNEPATVNAPSTPNPNAKPKPDLKTVPQQKRPWWKFWAKKQKTGDDNVPLGMVSPTPGKVSIETLNERIHHKKEANEYPSPYDETLEDDYGEAVWKNYIRPKDRDTMRVPLLSWMPSLPLIGKKVDTIYWLRKEVARLNVEIEQDQKTPEDYPLMNSAFLQFHSQVAAHMACQSLNHHVPQHMAPRLIEINPEDVIWENMRVKWWERYLRLGGVTALVTGLIILWAFPVAFVGLIAQISYLSKLSWLKWIATLPKWLLGVIQGILPPALMGLLLFLLPLFLRLLAKWSGIHTNMAVELSVQNWYFAFLVVQVFLVVSISQSITTVLNEVKDSPTSVPIILANNLPKSANFFFSYLMLQAFAVSGATLLQIGGLIVFFIFSPLLDSTAREKWKRQTSLDTMNWGTFFPVYTTLAVIGIVYSITSPIILFFNMVTFSLFWIVYRYNLMFVIDFRLDSGGLPFPKAVNQLFTGVYLLEGVLIGYFFIRDPKKLFPHAILMIVFFFGTMIYQVLLNRAFGPLFKYLPVTLEDDAADEDARFARRWQKKDQYDGLIKNNEANNRDEEEEEEESIEDRLRRKEEEEEAADKKAEEIELEQIDSRRRRETMDSGRQDIAAPEENNEEDNNSSGGEEKDGVGKLAKGGGLLKGGLNRAVSTVKKVTLDDISREKNVNNIRKAVMIADEDPEKSQLDTERHQGIRRGEAALFDDMHDEIEDLTPEERDALVEHAFQNKCLRARRPVIWIPRDELGVSDDEIVRTKRLSEYVWISNEHTGFDRRGRVVYRYNPPDFDHRDLIEL